MDVLRVNTGPLGYYDAEICFTVELRVLLAAFAAVELNCVYPNCLWSLLLLLLRNVFVFVFRLSRLCIFANTSAGWVTPSSSLESFATGCFMLNCFKLIADRAMVTCCYFWENIVALGRGFAVESLKPMILTTRLLEVTPGFEILVTVLYPPSTLILLLALAEPITD